jgi:hypothetical protein
MRVLGFAGFGLAFLLLGGCAPAVGPAYAPGYYPPAAYQAYPSGPHPDYGPAWTGSASQASPYAPNGSTGYAPYSQDSYDTVVHDGANGGGGGGGRQ